VEVPSKKKSVIKNFKEVPQVCPQKKKGLVEKKVSKKFFKCALKEKSLPKTSFKEVLQVCP
jgi:hypothetical protein